jgi:Arc/MetJ family transcription regulator
MATNLALDDKIVNEAKQLGGHNTKRAAVSAALEEYINRRKRRNILKLFGQLDWDVEYDYKKERKKR